MRKLARLHLTLPPWVAAGFFLLIMWALGSAQAVRAQQVQPSDPLTVTENYLLARDSGDLWGAADWCADLLELQDVDGSWFVDRATTTDWLRQLSERYMIDRLSPLVIDGNTVSWTERLTPRAPFSGAAPRSIVVDVHALVGAGKITYLSGSYPPIPLRSAAASVGAPQPKADTSRPMGVPATNSPDTAELPGRSASAAPGTLFLGATVTLLAALVIAPRATGAVVGTWRRNRRTAEDQHN